MLKPEVILFMARIVETEGGSILHDRILEEFVTSCLRLAENIISFVPPELTLSGDEGNMFECQIRVLLGLHSLDI